MEVGRVRGNHDDNPRLPTLTLGLSSVRLIVSKLEDPYTRVATKNLTDAREILQHDPNKDDDSLLVESRGQVLKRFVVNLGKAWCKCIPSVTFANFGVLSIIIGLSSPRMLSYFVLYPFCRLIFGTLYPAYASYKAVRTKNLKEYVKWMMYWIVFALFTCTETFTDMFLSWFPFYYEVKIVLVLWLLSPATKGSSILYRKFVHPALCRREQEIDEYIAKAKDQGYHTVLNLGTKGVNYATTVIMQTAIKGGGGLVQQLRKSYSLSDLTDCELREERSADETDDVLAEPRLVRRAIKTAYAARRSASESNSRQPMYFPEVDVDVRSGRSSRNDEPDFGHIKSSEDISSGYSSADTSAAGALPRTGSLRPRGRAPRAALTNIKRPPPAEESEVIIEELHENDTYEYANMPPLVNLPCPLLLSQTDPPFIYQCIGDQIRIVQVLANFPAFANMSCGYPDNRDQKETTVNENKFNNETITNKNKKDLSNEASITSDLFKMKTVDQNEFIIGANETDNIRHNIEQEIISEHLSKDDVILVDTTIDNTDADETDDEASFGTPDNSPRSKRTSKGRYGKGKAPPPPNVNNDDNRKSSLDCSPSMTSLESLTDIVNALPNIEFKKTVTTKTLQVINPIAEKKIRHKSRSSGIVSKASSSGIVKLLQLPGKLAFWNKNEESSSKTDTTSTTSDHSRRSSTTGKTLIDEFQSCTDLNTILTEASQQENEAIFKDANDIADGNINTHHIMEKSDALKKLIEAKLESHPEYKFVSLHDDIISTTSKSTDV